MMILDVCFILEILSVNYHSKILTDYDENDPVFDQQGRLHVIQYVKRDMLMLKNQIPMMVLYILTEVEISTTR
jgi:hypothetical protein